MTKVCGQPSHFAASALEGFSLAHYDLVRLVKGGVIRATPGKSDKVALVVGGGAGHYPAFAGYVGYGFADAAVVGDVFASPSSQAVINVSRQASLGGGILLGFGNYAGDVLNFSIAAQRLRDEGVDVRLLAVTDDVASADNVNHLKRRGIAGEFVVLKIAAAAAEAGLSLDDVERVGKRANELTRTFGIAFDGCTIPGEKEQLFTVPDRTMVLGLGVHGEPGIEEQSIPEADKIAAVLFERVMKAAPEGASKRVAVLLNGLGCTKQEELFVLWKKLTALFKEAGVTLVAPLVGEYVTSLDMAGCSLTVTWLNDELETFWRAEVCSPALTRKAVTTDTPSDLIHVPEIHSPVEAATTADGKRGGECISKAISVLTAALADAETELGRIDAKTGDGDHGQGMARGSAAADAAARQAVKEGAGAATVLALAADAWAERAGGTSGALWGEGLRAFSTALDNEKIATKDQLVEGARRACSRLTELGRAKRGDKTLMDALIPFAETFEAQAKKGLPLGTAWTEAAAASQKAADDTANLVPLMGRARLHPERSRGVPDAGALSMALATVVIGQFISSQNSG